MSSAFVFTIAITADDVADAIVQDEELLARILYELSGLDEHSLAALVDDVACYLCAGGHHIVRQLAAAIAADETEDGS
jgi:hypothetical protein